MAGDYVQEEVKFWFLRELFEFSDESQDSLDQVVAGAFNAAINGTTWTGPSSGTVGLLFLKKTLRQS